MFGALYFAQTVFAGAAIVAAPVDDPPAVVATSHRGRGFQGSPREDYRQVLPWVEGAKDDEELVELMAVISNLL
jgi:hypothetical protein